MSPRTLQRRLAEHGQSYADLLATAREGAAKSYLSDRRISVAEVAYLLGFAEQSSFTRAFKRWTDARRTSIARYLDKTKPRRRPFCSAAVRGNRAKVATFRERQRS